MALTGHVKIGCFRVIVFRIAPAPDFCRLTADIDVGIRVKQPERHVHPLDFLNMVIFFEYPGEERLSFIMPFERFDRRVLIQLERNHEVGTQRAGELTCDDDMASAVGAARRRRRFIADDFAAAGRAGKIGRAHV